MGTFYKYIVLLISIILCNSLYGQEVVSKKIKKTYDLTNTGELHIDNKYGEVLINGWNKNTIEIVATIKVTHKKKEKATSLLDRVMPNFRTARNLVAIKTEIGEKNASTFSKYFKKVNPFDFDKSNVEINYTIYLPVNAEINLTNKFGDVIISDWNGKLKATLQHGDLWIGENLNNATIDMKFGKLNAKSITYGNLNFKNGEINLDESRILELNSSGTTIDVTKIGSLELYSNKDEMRIRKVAKFNAEVKFSDIYINELVDKMTLNARLADIKISKISNPRSSIKITQVSSDIDININNFSFQFSALLEQGLLRIPTSFKNVKTNVINKGKKIREINASYGKNTTGDFYIKGIKGVIVLKE